MEEGQGSPTRSAGPSHSRLVVRMSTVLGRLRDRPLSALIPDLMQGSKPPRKAFWVMALAEMTAAALDYNDTSIIYAAGLDASNLRTGGFSRHG